MYCVNCGRRILGDICPCADDGFTELTLEGNRIVRPTPPGKGWGKSSAACARRPRLTGGLLQQASLQQCYEVDLLNQSRRLEQITMLMVQCDTAAATVRRILSAWIILEPDAQKIVAGFLWGQEGSTATARGWQAFRVHYEVFAVQLGRVSTRVTAQVHSIRAEPFQQRREGELYRCIGRSQVDALEEESSSDSNTA